MGIILFFFHWPNWKTICKKERQCPLLMDRHFFTQLTFCCTHSLALVFTVWSKDSQINLKTIFRKLSDPMMLSLPLRNIEEGSPAEPGFWCLSTASLSLWLCCGNVWVYAPSAGIVQTGRRANQSASLAWSQPCQLWSCGEDEWMPSTLHCWGLLCAPSVALERGHNLLLSALMVPSVNAEMAGLGIGAARWILPRAYCH